MRRILNIYIIDYSQEVDVYTNSEMCSDDTSYLAANPNPNSTPNPVLTKYQQFNRAQQQLQQQLQLQSPMSVNGTSEAFKSHRHATPSNSGTPILAPMSLVIREKKLPKTNEFVTNYENTTLPPPNEKPTSNYDDWSSVSSHYYNNFQSARSPYSSAAAASMLEPPMLVGRQHAPSATNLGVDDEDKRSKNYQELSESINDLFSNLLRHLEKQKNKDYLINCDSTSIDLNNTSPSTKKNSKDSNKDSGFNQESFYNMNNTNSSPSLIVTRKQQQQPQVESDEQHQQRLHHHHQQQQQEKKQSDEESVIQKFNKNSEFNNFHSRHNNEHVSSSEFSLLERYLNNEQIIANKHAQIERLLDDWFREQCGSVIDDYSIIDYLLNQEGISMRTFAQLVREKFDYIEWPREIIVELYRIVNGDVYESDDEEKTVTRGGVDNTGLETSGIQNLRTFHKFIKIFPFK